SFKLLILLTLQGVAVVPPDGPLLCVTVTNAVANFGFARVLVDGVGSSTVRICDHHGTNCAIQTYENKLFIAIHLVKA
uniref:Secreted protein n=1 Tax=Lates calcarifer TaxID=8187 RepID=A0A4W6FQT3_LATCA